jgi:hypothetical protein
MWNNNNTFTWSGPSGVLGCTGQRPVGHACGTRLGPTRVDVHSCTLGLFSPRGLPLPMRSRSLDTSGYAFGGRGLKSAAGSAGQLRRFRAWEDHLALAVPRIGRHCRAVPRIGSIAIAGCTWLMELFRTEPHNYLFSWVVKVQPNGTRRKSRIDTALPWQS